MNIKFQRATVKDADKIINIRNQCFHSDYIKYGECPGYNISKENMERYIKNNLSYKIICDNKIVGNVSVRDNNDTTYYLCCLCIIPDYENKGIGQESLKFLENQFPNATKWTLETPADKKKNHYFYKKVGYTIINEYMDGSVKVVLFEKKTSS
ncbi:GNAT family N-acetyltransferase [Vallitalea guaymasensis]|uniref:GNAT family N-acetyltransferase n=1 Tax=Vallitalea guaymasensis TaxID=1185412 RepID=UPI00272A1733|nr:GNAT family N-acetyltransferase [Vallitalea guaymasensis]